VGYNLKTGPFAGDAGRDGRRAFSLAIDRAALADALCNHRTGCAAANGGLISKGLPGYLGDGVDVNAKFDAAGAKSLYAAWDPDGSKVKGLTYTYDTSVVNKLVCDNVAAQWKQNLGVTVACVELDRKTFLADRNGGCAYTLFRQSWSADYNNPQDWFDYLFVSHAVSGGSCYSNPTLDTLVATADAKPVGLALSYYQAADHVLIADVVYAALVYGESFDIDHDGHIAVCDRGANAVKIYSANGSLLAAIKVQAPISVSFLPGDEIVVTSANAEHLVNAYDLAGRLVRDYGDREEIADRADLNIQANFGHIATDDAGNNYFSFDYLPEPTVRKFDRVGYLALEISLKTLEFEPAAQAARKAIARSENTENSSMPSLHRIISAVGVDSHSQELWIAIGTLLMRFDKEGMRLSSFRMFLPHGGALEPSQILVDRDKLLMGADPQGIYEYTIPQKLPQ